MGEGSRRESKEGSRRRLMNGSNEMEWEDGVGGSSMRSKREGACRGRLASFKLFGTGSANGTINLGGSITDSLRGGGGGGGDEGLVESGVVTMESDIVACCYRIANIFIYAAII